MTRAGQLRQAVVQLAEDEFADVLAAIAAAPNRRDIAPIADVGKARPRTALCQAFESGTPGISRLAAKLLLDAKQLIVFRGAVGTRQRAGLDLTAVTGHREVGDRGILGLAGAMRHHGCVAGLMRGFDGRERLGKRADLVDLDEDRIADPVSDPLGQPRDVGDKDIVADELTACAEFLRQ